MLSLHTSYGEYHTKVFYISLCLNGREMAFKHPYFLVKRGSPKQYRKTAPHNNNNAKVWLIFHICK